MGYDVRLLDQLRNGVTWVNPQCYQENMNEPAYLAEALEAEDKEGEENYEDTQGENEGEDAKEEKNQWSLWKLGSGGQRVLMDCG
ncbi:hypothetical protein EV126DRAFT_515619 [Verticillium dahliae]|nr:hypothetical protein EV126DRAFT_515619 [Verticillium dahliae]